MITLEDVEAAVRSALGDRYSDALWQRLVRDRYVADMPEMTESDVQYAVVSAMAFAGLAKVPRPSKKTHRGHLKPAVRWHAIGTALAIAGARDPEVVELRARIGRRVRWEDLDEWFEQQAARDGSPTRWVTVPLDDDGLEVQPGRDLRLHPRASAFDTNTPAPREVLYRMPTEPKTRSRPTAIGGVLEALRRTSERMASENGWRAFEATVWIVTGVPAPYAALQGIRREPLGRYGVARRIVMTVDPVMSAADVASLYASLRGRTRYRTMSEKHVRLAGLVAQRGDRTWLELMAAWNGLAGARAGWSYERSQLSNFARDARAAYRRLLQTG
jgi:hypothetical protein